MADAMLHDLIVVGGAPAGLSLAVEAQQSGLRRVLILEPGDSVVPAGVVGSYGLQVRYLSPVERVVEREAGPLVVETATDSYLTRVCAVVERAAETPVRPPFPLPDTLLDRIHFHTPRLDVREIDVLVVGSGERAVEALCDLVAQGARVVLSFTGAFDDLSMVSRRALADLEREQRATVLWRSAPTGVEDVGGYPMVLFDDRRTPDLQFDHVVFALGLADPAGAFGVPEVVARSVAPSGLYFLEDVELVHPPGEARPFHVVPAGRAWDLVRLEKFASLPDLAAARRAVELDARRIEHLRAEHYNATITHFDTAHNELWRLRIRPDGGDVAHRAGQYVTLGLGYWEPRIDDVADSVRSRESLVRRSYSISSPIFDRYGYLVEPAEMEEVELYIVLVRAGGERVPALTPRLALKRVGDRVYLGPKIAGRYSLTPVRDPEASVVFLATGTGEAPHNAMVVELLRKGHAGPILSAVSVRYESDLAYLVEHRRLEERFGRYHYLGMATRHPDRPKRYLQDLLEDGTIEETLGLRLDPANAHVFLCGNPSMIGLPEWEDGRPSFPDTVGVVELLHRRGFAIDHRGAPGNVHYEEYW